jgi:hypothetical protein
LERLAHHSHTAGELLKHETVTLRDPTVEEMAAAAASPSLEDVLCARDEWAQKTLRAAGLPDTIASVEDASGRGVGARELTRDNPHSPEWFAARILAASGHVRTKLKADDTPGATMAMHLLGELVHLAFVAGFLADDVMHGRAHREQQAEKASKPRRVDIWERVAQIDAEMRWPTSANARALRIRERMDEEELPSSPGVSAIRQKLPTLRENADS